MQQISINKHREVNTSVRSEGDYKNILILEEKDLELERLSMCMHGQSLDILVLPRELTTEELEIVYPYLYNGIKKVCKTIILNK